MFASAFASNFAGRGGRGGFSSAFDGCFAGRALPVVAGFIGPMRAQAALTDGAAWAVDGHALRVGGKVLIGPAGKTFRFESPVTAARWVDNAKNIGTRERVLIATIDQAAAVIWKAKKREKLAVIAGRVVAAAAKQGDEAKRAALLAESDYCLSKWG